MKVEGLSIHCLRIPFVQAFAHATKDRSESDAIIVALRAGGAVGYGEALPRDYVTGETESSVLDCLTRHVWPRLEGVRVDASPGELLAAVGALLDTLFADVPPTAPGSPLLIAHHSARCALELALLDLGLKLRGLGLAELLPRTSSSVVYSGVISSGSVERARVLARKMLLGGLEHIKIKVGDELDEARVAAVREVVGQRSLRVDANGAWTLEVALRKLDALAELGVASCEEPLGRARRDELPALVARSPVPIVVDESLVTEADGAALLERRGCHGFNLRLSKLGGLSACLRLARSAAEQGVWCQLGSHVGETSLLAAAGRHLALHLGQLRFAEGSFGSLLLATDIASPSVKFGHGGRGGPLTGPGLGVNVLPERLATLAAWSWSSR